MLHDLRFAFRVLRRNPSFTFVALLTLSLGIGASTAMFSVLNATILRPLPFPEADRLVMIWTEIPAQNLREGRSGYRDIEDWAQQARSISDLAVFDGLSINVTGPGEPARISLVRVSPAFFSMTGIRPIRGRVFTAEETGERARVVLISQSFWETRFGGSDNAIGSTLEIDGVPSQIVGVVPSGAFFAGTTADAWEPHTLFPDWETRRSQRGAGSWSVLARLASGTSLVQAQAELNTIAARLDHERPASEQGRGIAVVPLSLHLFGARSRLAVWLLTSAVLCVLLIAVVNIANLLLARGAGREREMAIRAALGASRAHVIRQLLVESLTLGLCAGVLGVMLARLLLPVFVALQPATLPGAATIDIHVLLWSLGLSVLTGMLVGALPALAVARRDLRPALHDGGRGSSAGQSTRSTRRALVVCEFALAIVLLVAAGLFTRSLLKVQNVGPGFDPHRVLSLQLSLPPFPSDAQRTNYYEAVVEQVRGVPGVESAGVIGDLFVGGNTEQPVMIDGATTATPERIRLRRDEISDELLATLHVPVLRGRSFSREDGADGPRVAVINETMARRLWPGQEALGKRFKPGTAAAARWFSVVGIVPDMRRQTLETEPVAQMFEPLAQNPSRLATLLVRTSIDPVSMVESIRAAIGRVDRRAISYGVTTLEARLDALNAQRRLQTSLLVAFSCMALLLAAIGIYGVIQYSIDTRTREFGIRLAVGAAGNDIFRMVVGEGLRLALAGLLLGLLGAWWLGRAGSSLLFGVSPTDVPTYALVSALLTAVAIVSCSVPALRASRVNPLQALRSE